jgi:uncharacterized membrane protein YhiD involved in acid resistance
MTGNGMTCNNEMVDKAIRATAYTIISAFVIRYAESRWNRLRMEDENSTLTRSPKKPRKVRARKSQTQWRRRMRLGRNDRMVLFVCEIRRRRRMAMSNSVAKYRTR